MKPAFFFYANPYRPRGIVAAAEIAPLLTDSGCRVYSESWLSAQGIGDAAEVKHMPEDVQALVAFGGDGTLLRAATDAFRQNVPMLGVNTGSVGFLMDFSPDDPQKIVRALLEGDCVRERCPVLRVKFDGQEYLALNDVSVTRGEHPGVIETTVLCDGEMVMNPHGDGVVIATPLGSTAYALSSGGPILRPDAPCLTVTPIAARELLLRTVLLPLDAALTLRVHGSGRRRLQLALDGQTLLPVTKEATLEIRAAEGSAQLIRPGDHHFFTTLRRKQRMWNEETEQE